MHRGHHRVPVRPQHATHFGEERSRIPQVLEDQTAHHGIEPRVAERQRIMQVVNHETRAPGWDLAARRCEHSRREVDRGDAGSGRGQPGGVPAGPAAEIQHVTAADVAERLADARFLQGRQRIGVMVVNVRPPVVAGAHA